MEGGWIVGEFARFCIGIIVAGFQ